jgi:biopolymer transport protein ExbD
MNNGGLIIRLIDVAMIILFGFIAISDIKVQAQIKLPSKDEDPQEQKKDEKEPTLIFVKIGMTDQVEITDDATLFEFRPISGLEPFLVELKESYNAQQTQMVVLLEPDEDSIMQHTIDVLDICERQGIPKNINYESLQF